MNSPIKQLSRQSTKIHAVVLRVHGSELPVAKAFSGNMAGAYQPNSFFNAS
jgi:hypothetical protein